MTPPRFVSIDEDDVIGNGGGAVDGGRDGANMGDEDSVVIGGVDGGVLFLSNGLTRSNWGKLRFGSYLVSASLKTTEELVYTEDASTAVAEVVLPVYELVVSGGASVIVGMAGDDGLTDLLPAVEIPGNRPEDGALDSLAALPRFLLANSYMSPNIPAKVLRRFFMVSSASSATDVCDCAGRGGWF